MVQARDGQAFQGLWRKDGETGWHDNWQLRKISNVAGSCPHWKPAGAKGNLIANDLAQTGRVRLYGITFDSDSDRLRAEAEPTLDQVVAALNGNAGWKSKVEGHTDSTSTPPHNQDLSARRAAAVKAYLDAAGISDARVVTVGFGQDKPVATSVLAARRRYGWRTLRLTGLFEREDAGSEQCRTLEDPIDPRSSLDSSAPTMRKPKKLEAIAVAS